MLGWRRYLALLNTYSSLTTALIALLALVVAILQIDASNTAQREATAQSTYSEYLKMAFEHPSLANGTPDRTPGNDQLLKYPWFVSFMLHSGEHIYLASPDDPTWIEAIKDQVRPHSTILCGEEYQTILSSHFDSGFRELVVEQALESCRGLHGPDTPDPIAPPEPIINPR